MEIEQRTELYFEKYKEGDTGDSVNFNDTLVFFFFPQEWKDNDDLDGIEEIKHCQR